MVFMVSTALSVALPAIQRDLDAGGTDLIWIVNAYSLLQAAFIFLSGSFGDHYGRKRVYIIGIVLFAISSLVCGVTEFGRSIDRCARNARHRQRHDDHLQPGAGRFFLRASPA